MTESAVVSTDIADSVDAGKALGLQISEALQGPPDVVILFAAPTYEKRVIRHSFSVVHQQESLPTLCMEKG